MQYETIGCPRRRRVLDNLDRPPVNAATVQLSEELLSARAPRRRGETRCIVLTGAGGSILRGRRHCGHG
jgi:hypothetical protein